MGWLALAGWLLCPGVARPVVTMDPLGGTWRDDFADLGGLALNQQGALAAPAGYTIDGAIQSWTQPYSTTGFSETFSASGILPGPTTAVGNPGSTAEFLTLWQTRLDPGGGLLFCKTCAPHPGGPCPITGESSKFQNGIKYNQEVTNAPYQGTSALPAVGWDMVVGPDVSGVIALREICPLCAPGVPWFNSIQMCVPGPLIFGNGVSSLIPYQGYTVSFLTSVQLGPYTACTATPYLVYALNDLNHLGPSVATTMYEGDFTGAVVSGAFNQMTPVSLELDPAMSVPGALWDFNIYSAVLQTRFPDLGGHPHVTMVGPVWVTAHKGTLASRVFDTLSDRTQWVDISWTVDQATIFTDSTVSPIPLGAPLTPVQLSYAVSNTLSAQLPVTFTVTHGGEATPGMIGMNMVNNVVNFIHDKAGAAVSGRYFQWSVTLYGRGAAQELDSDLAPAPGAVYFGGYLPALKRVSVRYYVCAARAQSRRIAPTSVKRWLNVDYASDVAQGGTVSVDVLGDDGAVLMAGVASGASLGGIDPYRHPALVLRASLESDAVDCSKRPVLTAWQVRWEPLVDVIEVACNSLRPHLGETCAMEVRVERAGPVKVEVHDAAGQLVKTLVDAELPAEAHMLSWDGRNGRGEVVAAGVYFVVARVPGGHRVRRLAVVR